MRHRGPVTPKKARLSEDALAALNSGDVDRLLAVNRARFGGWRMMADEDEDEEDEETDDSGTGEKKSKDSGSSGADEDEDDTEDLEREALRKRMKAADKRAAEAERALKKIEDADKSELERAQSALADLEKERDELRTEVQTLRLKTAFLTSNKHSWHNADVALALAESQRYLEGAVDDETGEVDRKVLGKALDRLATEHAYLIAKTDKEEKEEPKGPSGEPASSRSDNQKDEKAKEATLKKRFPVLNR